MQESLDDGLRSYLVINFHQYLFLQRGDTNFAHLLLNKVLMTIAPSRIPQYSNL